MNKTQIDPPAPGLPAAAEPPQPDLRPIILGSEICQNPALGGAREWVITNGLGGYASSTVLGMNTRRFHGLLVAATHPPVGRVSVMSKLEETLVVPGARFDLSTNRYSGVIHPEGYRYLVEFRQDPWPTFFYRIGEILLEKSIFMLPGENATVIGYTLHAAAGPVELVIKPLVSIRDFRSLCREDVAVRYRLEMGADSVTVRTNEDFPPLVIHHNAEIVERSPCWYRNFEYPLDEVKGREDLWSFGNLRYLLKVGESCGLVASTGRRGTGDLAFHRRRVENTQTVLAQTIKPLGAGPLSARLNWTAENFCAYVSIQPTGSAYVLAGLPSALPWGRDALISLPGLAIEPRRVDLARMVLQTLAGKVKDGLIPVRFSETQAEPEYDSADTSLWFFWAVWHYWKGTRDFKFVSKKLLDPLQEIMHAYLEGTKYGIGMGEDGLIQLAEEEMPLTWMDAREPGTRADQPGPAVTPRAGKPVEVNALWYCSLQIMGEIAERLGLKRSQAYSRLARLVQQNFSRNFSAPKGLIYDRIGRSAPDLSIRPNMLIAASLPFSPLTKAQSLAVLETVEKELLTPMGVRTLNPSDPMYRGRYEGDLRNKAHAYHQGTIWTWLIGPYVSTVCKVRTLNRTTQAQLANQLKAYLPHLEEGSLGSVSELFEGDAPHSPRGSPSQAWSVGEILRSIRLARLGGL